MTKGKILSIVREIATFVVTKFATSMGVKASAIALWIALRPVVMASVIESMKASLPVPPIVQHQVLLAVMVNVIPVRQGPYAARIAVVMVSVIGTKNALRIVEKVLWRRY
jgi:hypothetical protein